MNPPIVAIDARSVGRPHTGDATYWTGLIRGITSLDSNLRYLFFSNAPRPAAIPESDRFQWIELNSHSNRWWSLVRFPLAARRMGARVIHTQYNLSPLVTRGGISTIHDVSFYHEPAWFKPRDRVLLQRFVPASARRASLVITVSEFSRREIEQYISGVTDKVRVVPNACPDELQRMEPGLARIHVRETVGIDGPFLLAVGTRWPRKNLNLAIAAVDSLPEELPHTLAVTGKAGWGDEVEGCRAKLTGYVDDRTLSALYSAAELYLAPARYEGFGITLLEAFRAGCPVLASDIPAHREVGATAAAYAPDNDGPAWTKAIRSLLSHADQRATLRNAGFEREAKFTWRDAATATEAVYRELL